MKLPYEHKFPTMKEAKARLKARGELKYFGRDGTDAKTYVYTLTIGFRVYHVFLYEDGLVKITHETFKAPSQE